MSKEKRVEILKQSQTVMVDEKVKIDPIWDHVLTDECGQSWLVLTKEDLKDYIVGDGNFVYGLEPILNPGSLEENNSGELLDYTSRRERNDK